MMPLIPPRRFATGALAVLGLLPALGCSDDDKPSTPQPTSGTVRIEIEHTVGGEELDFDAIQYTNAFGNEYGVSRLEYYLSDFHVMGPDGRADLPGAFYIDARNPATHTILIENVPEGHYHEIGFTYGLDAEDNVSGALENTIENRGMEWPETWGGGYHYMKLEGRFRDGQGEEKGFLTHTGRFHDPSVQRMDEHHFVDETFELHQNIVAGQTLVLSIEMDVNEWYEDPNTIDLESHSTGIMMNLDRQVELEENCGSVFTLHGGGTHGRPAGL